MHVQTSNKIKRANNIPETVPRVLKHTIIQIHSAHIIILQDYKIHIDIL